MSIKTSSKNLEDKIGKLYLENFVSYICRKNIYVCLYIFFILYIDKVYLRNGNSRLCSVSRNPFFFTYKYLVFFVSENMNTVFDLQICSLDSMLCMYETMYIIILDKTCGI